jgi:hypothetical protein
MYFTYVISLKFQSVTSGSYMKSEVCMPQQVLGLHIPCTRWLAGSVEWRLNRLKHARREGERKTVRGKQAIQSYGLWHVDTHIKTLFILLLYLKGNENYAACYQVTSLYICWHSKPDHLLRYLSGATFLRTLKLWITEHVTNQLNHRKTNLPIYLTL